MDRRSFNLAPATLLASVTLLFATVWSHDHPPRTVCANVTQSLRRDGTAVRYPATTGLFTTGRAALRSTLAAPLLSTAANAASPTNGQLATRTAPAEPAAEPHDWLERLLARQPRESASPTVR